MSKDRYLRCPVCGATDRVCETDGGHPDAWIRERGHTLDGKEIWIDPDGAMVLTIPGNRPYGMNDQEWETRI
jgi:hypothetical protein